MALRPSIVFLFDLDLPSVRPDNSLVNSDDEFPSQCIGLLRHVVLNILNYFSEKQINVQWGYRFYSSSSYQLTNKAHFVELTTQTVEEFEESLSVRFEQNNTLVDEASLNQMTGASVLSRTLQDILSDYDWKTPSDSLTPTRKGKKAGKQLDQSLQNLVFIFTEVPTDEAIRSFCRFSVQDELSVKSVTDAILPKELAKRFQEFQLSLNFIDMSSDKKTIFSKIASNLRGAVINALSFTSPFSFSQILQASCLTEINSNEMCHSCQSLSLGSRTVVLVLNEQQFEFQLQCWHPGCIKSTVCSEDENITNPVINCKTVEKTSVPNLSWLTYESLQLLSSRSTSIEKILSQKLSWIGQLNDRFCCISPLTSRTAFMLFPSSDCFSFRSWATSLFGPINQEESPEFSRTRNFVERILDDERKTSPCGRYDAMDDLALSIPGQSQNWCLLSHLKGNYVEKKGVHLGMHWQNLKNCFQNEQTQEKSFQEFNNNSFDRLSHSIPQNDSHSVNVAGEGGALKKIGSNRIQNLRASTLLQKSQEVRAKNDEIEREKINREKQVAEEKKEKIWKELKMYLLSLRSSIEFGEDMIKIVPNRADFVHQDILDRCLKLKDREFISRLEDWQLFCLVQVIASTILYVWKDNKSMLKGLETIRHNFLKKPGTVNRSTPKDFKVHEFKFQIMLRLELCWVLPSLIGEEEEVLQDTISLFQMLAIHSNPQLISTFFQDGLVVSFENMLPEFLVNLGEELNQPIPESLNDILRLKNSSRTPSPTLSTRTLSVHSVASQNELIDSQRSIGRDFRSRTLSRQPSLNVLQHKKQITLPNKVERIPIAPKKEESNEVVRVRRSLQFGGAETPLQKTRSKSPSKGGYTPRKLNTSFEPQAVFTTPGKATDNILAPETPSRLRSDNKNKKTDGIHVVGESPEIKQEGLRRSPRRLEAAIALRRRASFYSTLNSDVNPEKGASRNWTRGESQVWSEKNKANTSIQTMEDNSQQTGQSARFLFSKILSRNDSMPISDLGFSPRVNVVDPESSQSMPSLATPRKGSSTMILPPSTPSRQRLTFPEIGPSVLAQGTPQKTPMKTPKQVQFNFSFQPATPSSKVVPDPRSILKSPMSFQSHQSRTPCKSVPQDRIAHQMIHILDDTNFTGRHQLELHSPVKTEEVVTKIEERSDEFSVEETKLSDMSNHGPRNEGCEVHRLDENTLRPDEEVELQSPVKTEKQISIVSPLILRRSPRYPLSYQNNQASNFYQHNPNWSVVDYRRPTVGGSSTVQPRPSHSRTNNIGVNEDPYQFDEEAEIKPKRLSLADSSTHKRKLFQSSAEKTPIPKRRRIILSTSPIEESKTTPPSCKFQAPKDGSLFHLENSPLLNSIEAKFLA